MSSGFLHISDGESIDTTAVLMVINDFKLLLSGFLSYKSRISNWHRKSIFGFNFALAKTIKWPDAICLVRWLQPSMH